MANELRPLNLGELLDRTFTLYRNHFLLFVGITGLAQLFVVAGQTVFGAVLAGAGLAGPGTAGIALAIVGGAGGLFLIVLSFVANAVAQAATVFAVSAVYLDRPIGVREAYQQVKGKVGRIMNVIISTGIRIALGTLACVVPGIFLMLSYAVAVQSVVLEPLSASDAIKRSSALTEGRRGEIFVIFFLFWVISATVGGALTFPLTLMALPYAKTGAPWWLESLQVLAQFASATLVAPVLTIAMSLVYYDQRVRKEAFDLQLMLASVEGRAAAATAAPTPPVVGPSLGPA